MKIEWEKPDTWKCWNCDGRQFEVTMLSEFWVDYVCLGCQTEDATLKTDFMIFMEKESKNEKT